jgi:hypothetical protein
MVQQQWAQACLQSVHLPLVAEEWILVTQATDTAHPLLLVEHSVARPVGRSGGMEASCLDVQGQARRSGRLVVELVDDAGRSWILKSNRKLEDPMSQ